MQVYQIVLLVLAGIVLFILISICSVLLFEHFKKEYLEHYCERSYSFLNTYPGLYTIVVGEIGAGKTTFASGFTNYKTVYLNQLALDKIEETLIRYPEVDFNKIDEMIEYLYLYGDGETKHVTNSSYICNFILSEKIDDDHEETYEEIFGGKLKFKKTESNFNLEKPLQSSTGSTYYLDLKNEKVDKDGFLLDDSFNKIPIFDKLVEYTRDDEGIIKFDKFFNPIVEKK